MGIIQSIKRIFGGSAPDEQQYVDANDDMQPAATIADPAAGQRELLRQEMVRSIFGTVVDAFNQALPDYLSASVDPERERQSLYSMLDESVKDYLGAIEDRQLAAGRREQELAGQIEALTRERDNLQAQLNGWNQRAVNQAMVDEYEARLAELREANERQAIEMADMEQRLNQGEQLRNEHLQQSDQAAKDLTEMAQRIAALEEEAKIREARIEDLQRTILVKESIIAEHNDTDQEIQDIQEQMERFADIRGKMEERIEKLREQLRATQTENESLRQTIKNNLLQNAHEQKQLREQIAKLEVAVPEEPAEEPAAEKEASATEPKEAKAPKRGRKRKRTDVPPPDVDEIMANTDWLVSKPAQEESMRTAEDNPDFGYQPPQRKHRVAANDAQLSLFD